MKKILEVLAALTQQIAKLDADNQAVISALLSQLMEVTEYLHAVAETTETRLQEVLQKLVDEFFIDVHLSLIMVTGGQPKAACVLLRTALEISVLTLFFRDHPVEAFMWSENDSLENREDDQSVGEILTLLSRPNYFEKATGREIDKTRVVTELGNLREVYRALSVRVHGRYAYLTASQSSGAVNEVAALGTKMLLALSIVAGARASSS